MVPDLLAQQLLCLFTLTEVSQGLAEVFRGLHNVAGIVSIACELERRHGLVLDAVHAGLHAGIEGEVWVGITPGDTELDTQGLPTAYYSEGGGSVVEGPQVEVGRSP